MLDKVVAFVNQVLDPNHIAVTVIAEGDHNVNQYPVNMIVKVDQVNTGFLSNLFFKKTTDNMAANFNGKYIDLDITGAAGAAIIGNIQDVTHPPAGARINTPGIHNAAAQGQPAALNDMLYPNYPGRYAAGRQNPQDTTRYSSDSAIFNQSTSHKPR